MPDPEENQKSGTEPNKPITKEGVSRIQSTQAKKHGGEVGEGDFPPRAHSAADKHENKKN